MPNETKRVIYILSYITGQHSASQNHSSSEVGSLYSQVRSKGANPEVPNSILPDIEGMNPIEKVYTTEVHTVRWKIQFEIPY